MSETKTITGKCSEVSERGDWTTFHIDIGTQYPVRLATKLDPLVELGRAASKSDDTFDWTYNEVESDKINEKSGKPFINRYLEAVEAAGSVATPDATPQGRNVTGSGDGMSKDDWGRKDSAIHMMAAIKAAADALKHTVPADPTPEDLHKFIERTKTLSYNWWQRADAVRKGDDSDLPFASESDEAIGYPE
jgi:hypothetical protein